MFISVLLSDTISKTSVTSGAGTTNPSGAHEFTLQTLSGVRVLIRYGCTITGNSLHLPTIQYSGRWFVKTAFKITLNIVNSGNIYNKFEDVRVSLVEQELLTIPKHLSSSPVFIRVHFAQSLVISVVFCRSLSFCLCFFFLAIVFSVFDIRLMIIT